MIDEVEGGEELRAVEEEVNGGGGNGGALEFRDSVFLAGLTPNSEKTTLLVAMW